MPRQPILHPIFNVSLQIKFEKNKCFLRGVFSRFVMESWKPGLGGFVDENGCNVACVTERSTFPALNLSVHDMIM